MSSVGSQPDIAFAFFSSRRNARDRFVSGCNSFGVRGGSHLPAADTQQEADHVRLLLLLKLLDVLKGTHLKSRKRQMSAFSAEIGARRGIGLRVMACNSPCRFNGRLSLVVVVGRTSRRG